MLIEPEAFVHVPYLVGKIIAPEKSALRISRAAFEGWDQLARTAGFGVNWRRSHEDREATRQKALAGRLDRDLWIFAYGSLMWDPAIEIVEIRTATLKGFHRRFCLETKIGRGSPERPALMAALDTGGECRGLAFRVPAQVVDRETEILWMREMISDGYIPIIAGVETPQGDVEALAFVVNKECSRFCEIDLTSAARIIATGKGLLGSNLEYFNNLAEHMQMLGIDDRLFKEIRSRLAESFTEQQPPHSS